MRTLSQHCCPLCGGTELPVRLVCEDRLTHLGRFEIRRCTGCGLQLTDPQPHPDDLHEAYASPDYLPVRNDARGFTAGLYRRVRALMLGVKRRWIREARGRTTGRLLDIGCGTGEFAAAMQQAGWSVQGVEPCEPARRAAVECRGVDALTLDEQSRLPDGSFDVITLWHSLEHMHDLAHGVRELGRLLTSDGLVVAAIPNPTSLDAERYGRDWAAYDVPRHLYHLTPAVMDELAGRNGFRVLWARPLWFDPPYIALLSEARHPSPSRLRGASTAARTLLATLRDPLRCTSLAYGLARAGRDASRPTARS